MFKGINLDLVKLIFNPEILSKPLRAHLIIPNIELLVFKNKRVSSAYYRFKI
jgi:hypothetical protein